MALIVENGTGLINAESYITVADASAYHVLRGNAAWSALTVTQQEQALRKATDYMSQIYSQNWKGVRINSTQALDFPRVGVVVNGYYVPSDSVPLSVKNACSELALKASAGELLADQGQSVVSEQVGVIKVEYDKSSPATVRYKAVDGMLSPFLSGFSGAGSVNVKLARG